jgi:hypothetical protein
MNRELAVKIESLSMPIPEAGCWIWMGTTDKGGYGSVCFKGESMRAHRASYLASKGEIPPHHYICHHCDVRSCVNPAHLFCGTPKDNFLDMRAKGRRVQSNIYGTQNGSAKLDEAKVLKIRALQGKKSLRQIGAQFQVSESLVRQIFARQIWKNI